MRQPSNADAESSELRKHYYLKRYVVIAPRRAKRPQQFPDSKLGRKSQAHHPIEDSPSILEHPGAPEPWRIKVVANKYPAFTPNNELAAGRQEVVLETPRINTPFHELSLDEITDVLRVYQARIAELRQTYPYVSVFKNHGAAAGASLAHTHSQIIATAVTPPDVAIDREAQNGYQQRHGTSALCDIVRWELRQATRVVAHTRYTTTLCPYASEFAAEAWLIPSRQAYSLADLEPAELRSLADHLKGIAQTLATNQLDFNLHLQEPVPGLINHCYLKVAPRAIIPSGFELNTGITINPISPETAAEWYRKYIKVSL